MFSSADVGSRGVVVITCASHAQGPRFDPGREHFKVNCKGVGNILGDKNTLGTSSRVV